MQPDFIPSSLAPGSSILVLGGSSRVAPALSDIADLGNKESLTDRCLLWSVMPTV